MSNIICKLAVTNIVMAWNFEVVTDEFNVDRLCFKKVFLKIKYDDDDDDDDDNNNNTYLCMQPRLL